MRLNLMSPRVRSFNLFMLIDPSICKHPRSRIVASTLEDSVAKAVSMILYSQLNGMICADRYSETRQGNGITREGLGQTYRCDS